MSACKCKILKILLWIVGGLVAFLLAAVLAMPLWFDAVVGGALRSLVPQLTETSFSLGSISFNPYTGRFLLTDCHLANPEGYAVKEAFSVAKVDVSIELGKLLDDCVHLKNVEVRDLYASYLDNDSVNNFAWIAARVAANLEKMGVKSDKEKEKKEGKEMKFVVERLSVSGTRIQLGKLPFALPVVPIELTGIGTENGGVTWKELCADVWAKAQKAFSGAGTGLGNAADVLLKGGASALGSAGDAAAKGMDALGLGEHVQNAGDAAAKGVGALDEYAKTAGSAAADGVKKLGGAAMDGVQMLGGVATNGVKELGGAAMDGVQKVGEGAKDLFKKAGGLFGK